MKIYILYVLYIPCIIYNIIFTKYVHILYMYEILCPDDTATISVSTIGRTTESGGTAVLSAVLDSVPFYGLTFAISSSDTTEGMLSTGSLTFTSGNWNSLQTVTVTGVDDFVVDGNITFNVTAGAISDSSFNGEAFADASFVNVDGKSVC
jgi:hypothetical protein